MSADPILARLMALHPVAIDMSLDRVRRLMDDLGRPQDALAPVIHIAGTNGKGSTVAHLRAILEATGRAVHVYTSPHLVRFNERIRVAGRLIEDADLVALLEEVERVNAGRPITFFEVTTAAAFLAFARAKADAVLLETGMGGRLDATNLVDRPVAAGLTPISMDHMSYLGDTLALIAAEKAGIIKPAVPCVVGPQPPAALAVFEARARELGAPLSRHGAEWTVMPRAAGFRYAGKRAHDLPVPALPGRHQLDNAGLAIAILEQTFDPTHDQIAAGLARAEWPARLQRLTGKLASILPAGGELWLDGGHNEGAGVVIAEWLKGRGPVDLVFGMLSTKDPAAFLAHVAPYVRRLRAVAIPDDRLTLPPQALVEAAAKVGVRDARAMTSIEAALADLADRPGRVLICGSLHLAGAVLARS